MMYGNYSMGFSYSPDRSRDVDRFNPSTRSNYSKAYNPNDYYSPISIQQNSIKSTGWYDGAGRYHNGGK